MLKHRSVLPFALCSNWAFAALPTREAPTADLPVEPTSDPLEIREARGTITVRRAPDPKAPRRGVLLKGETFYVLNRVEGPGCGGDGWASVLGEGFACLEYTRPSTVEPATLPRLLAFDPPTPEEYKKYVSSGKWERTADENTETLLPFVYGKRWRGWEGHIYTDSRAFLRGDEPEGQLEEKHKYRFERVEHTRKGDLLVLPDKRVVPLSEVYVYPTERFAGRDLVVEPVPDGLSLAWVTNYKGARLHDVAGVVLPAPPKVEGQPAEPAPGLLYHTQLLVEDDQDPKLVTLPDGLGPGQPATLLRADLTLMSLLPLPPEIGAEDLWIDVDVVHQVLVLSRGAMPLYATLVSTAQQSKGFQTPPGLYRISDKVLWNDMSSQPDQWEVYYVESVPWTMHYAPRFALHGAFWHWGFGHQASHGCVNLATLDADRIFDMVTPTLAPGWYAAYETPEDPGTLIRVRDGDKPVPDRRTPLK